MVVFTNLSPSNLNGLSLLSIIHAIIQQYTSSREPLKEEFPTKPMRILEQGLGLGLGMVMGLLHQ